MADLSQHTNYTGLYSGLLDNFWVTLAIGGLCFIGYEIEVHIPRRHGRQGTYRRVPVRVVHAARRAWGRWRSRRRKGEPEDGRFEKNSERSRTPREVLGSRESWEFAYIFQPKAWRLNPSPPVPRWPLAWIISSLRVKERDMPESCGLDVTLHMRFLRGSFFYVLLQACTVLPILMPVHVHYAPPEAKKSSMTRAGISSLVKSSGAHWLWIHAFLIWWVTITWTLTVLWITWGGLAYRRREIRKLARDITAKRKSPGGTLMVTAPTADGSQQTAVPVQEEPVGAKRFRTLMVENIPPDMRNEEVLRDYFDHYLERHRLRSGEITHTATWVKNQVEEKQGKIMRHVHFRPTDMFKTKQVPAEKVAAALDIPPAMARGDTNSTFDVIDQESADGMMETEVDEVILVRKLGAVASLRARRTAVLRQLEVAHVKLAQRVLAAVASYQKKNGYPTDTYTPLRPVHDVDAGLDALNGPRDEHLPGLSKDERLNRLTAALGSFVGDAPEQCGEGENTVWDVLHALPRGLLDPYQALTHLKVASFFRNQNAPLIDYLTTKLNYLSHRLDQAREKPLSSYGASSTAFVVFKDARTARLALKLLATHPTRTLACRASPAPDWTNLLWPRLAMSIYRSEFVRKWVIQLGVWVFTLLWIFPVSLLCALSSFTNIAGFFKPLRDFLSAHPKVAPAISSLAPVILVAGLTIAICPILLVVANKAETINTRLAVHNSVLERFWKFLMVNGVVFFAIGQSAIEAYLTAFQTADFDPLPVVASAFPTAAPYFASYILLQVAIQPCFEIFRFGLPTIVYVFGTRVSIIPRQRRARTEYPTFSHFSQVPQQLLQGAIMHLFMLLNPLVIPFTLVYYGMCYVVWKRQFTYVYGRLYENNGRRTSVRVLRYSLDALGLAQFVLFAFFVLNKAKGHAISTGFLFFITLGEKLIITRALVRRHDDLDVEEADIICPPAPETNGAEILEIISPSSDAQYPAKEGRVEQPVPEGLLGRAAYALKLWWDKWIFALSHRVEPGYRRPIPFDRLIFSFLDRHIAFKEEADHVAPLARSETDDELLHEPDHAIQHPIARTLVTRHHPLRPWEDIPPYPRSRGYSDQPAYTDDYDDFLWLPRDPLSTLDLDDTVEMRLSLTTSTGGSGKIGDWPPDKDEGEEDDYEILDGDADQSGGDFRPSSTFSTFGRLSGSEEGAPISPSGASEDHLLVPVHLPEEMGSETRGGAADLVRRGTRRMGEGLTSILRRPRAMTNQTDHSGLISMRTLSLASRRSHDELGGEHNRTVSSASGVDVPLRPTLASRPLTSVSLPITAVRPPPRRPTTGESAHSESSLLTVPQEMSTPTRLSPRMASGMSHLVPDAPLTESVEELDETRIPSGPATAPHATFETPSGQKPGSPSVRILGRSASGRRPSRLLSPDTTPSRGASEGAQPVTAPTLGRSGSSSLHTPSRDLLRVRSTRRERSESVSAAQQALMAEVIQEERIAAESSTHKENADKEREEGEVMKEQAKLKRVSRVVQKGLILGRSGSKREMGSLSSTGPEFGRRTSSARKMADGMLLGEGSGSRRLSAGPSGSQTERVEEHKRVDEMGRTTPAPPNDGST